MPESCVWLLEV